MLSVMLEKGWVKRDQNASPHIYRPAVTRETAGKRLARGLVDKVYGGATMSLAFHALKSTFATLRYVFGRSSICRLACLKCPLMTDAARTLSAIERREPVNAEEFLPLVYDQRRRLARAKLAREKPGPRVAGDRARGGLPWQAGTTPRRAGCFAV